MHRLLDLDGDLLVQEFKSLEIKLSKEEYKFLTPELNKNKFLPIEQFFQFVLLFCLILVGITATEVIKLKILQVKIFETSY